MLNAALLVCAVIFKLTRRRKGLEREGLEIEEVKRWKFEREGLKGIRFYSATCICFVGLRDAETL